MDTNKSRSENARNEKRDSEGRFESGNQQNQKSGYSDMNNSRSKSSYSNESTHDLRSENARKEPRDSRGRFTSSSEKQGTKSNLTSSPRNMENDEKRDSMDKNYSGSNPQNMSSSSKQQSIQNKQNNNDDGQIIGFIIEEEYGCGC